jgi:hypothetical protein
LIGAEGKKGKLDISFLALFWSLNAFSSNMVEDPAKAGYY